MDGKLLFCISVVAGENTLYGPEWKEGEPGKTLIDLFLQVCGTKVIGQQVQVLVSKDRSFLEAAVVQVCSPLVQLSQKGQSYIQFILKSSAHFVKNSSVFIGQRGKPNTTFKAKQNLVTPPFNIKDITQNDKNTHEHTYINWKDSTEADFNSFSSSSRMESQRRSVFNIQETPLHTLTTRPSFENMTVEEICEEIKRIKSNELPKTKISPWIEGSCTGKTKEANLKEKVMKSDASLTSDRTSKKVTPAKRTIIAGKSKAITKFTESAKNKMNSTRSTKPSSPPCSLSPSTAKPTAHSNFIISDRLSVLAQPRNRNRDVTSSSASPSSTTPPIRKSLSRKSLPENTKTKLSAKKTSTSPSMTRGSRVNSTFVKTGVKITTKTKGNEKSSDTSSEYFVEIFTKDKKGIAKVLNQAKNIDSHIKRLPDYSADSLMNQSVDKSYEKSNSSSLPAASESDDFTSKESEVSISDMLSKLNHDRLDNQGNNAPENNSNADVTPVKYTAELLNDVESSPDDAVIFDKSKASLDDQNESDILDNRDEIEGEERSVPKLDSSDENVKNTAKEILSNTSSISIENALNEYLSSSPKTSPVKSLFSPLFERNKLRHASSTPIYTHQSLRSKSVDNINLELYPNLHKHSKFKAKTDKGLSKSLDSLEENNICDVGKDEKLNKSECSEMTTETSATISNGKTENFTCKKSNNEENILWSNSRGIKFTVGDEETEHNRTFVLKDKENQDTAKKTENNHLTLPLRDENLAVSALKTPDKHRKHWGTSIKGMDSMLIPSLQAFSLELRTTTENAANRIRVLYEDWQLKFEGLEPSAIKTPKAVFPKASPKLDSKGGEQQGIAVVFRNLRKMEVKLKTIEQAAQAMVKALEEHNHIKDCEFKKTGVQRAKSFKWKELRNTARQTRSKVYVNEDNDRSSDFSTDSDT